MPSGDDRLPLTVVMPAAELALLRRRLSFLEAAVAQLLREEGQLREWFSATELAELGLPGLPGTRQGVMLLAKRERWPFRITRGRGGEITLYHYAGLPRQAFAGLIDLVLRGAVPRRAATPKPARATDGGRPTPPWVLPLVRLMRGGGASVEAAVRDLPAHLVPAEERPTPAEARAELRRLGMLRN